MLKNILAALVMMLALVACGEKEEVPMTEEAPAAEAPAAEAPAAEEAAK